MVLDKEYQLFSSQRMGSTMLYSYILSYNRTYFGSDYFTSYVEFFNEPRVDQKPFKNFVHIEQKIDFLEKERQKGTEYTWKAMASSFCKRDKSILDWYFNFYKNREHIFLIRKDLWRMYLSNLVSGQLFEQNRHDFKEFHNLKYLKSLYKDYGKIKITINKRHSIQFYKFLLETALEYNKDNIVYYEDINKEWLLNKFGSIDPMWNIEKIDVRYEDIIDNIKEVENNFIKWCEYYDVKC